MAWLKKQGYSTINPSQLFRGLIDGDNLPEKPIVVTFDDGARDCLLVARDILKKNGFTASVFIVTDHVGGTNVWDRGKGESEIDLLDWQDLEQLIGKAGRSGLTRGPISI